MLNRKKESLINGVYNISNEDYHSNKGISRSALMEFNKTPFHYWNSYINPDRPSRNKSTPATNFGNMIHTYILENKHFNDRYLIIKKMDKRTKAGIAYYKSLDSIKGNRLLIDENEFLIVKNIAESLSKDHTANQLIADAQYEKSIYWQDKTTGLICKVRPDIWHDNFIVDLKTAADACSREFQRSLFHYGYYLQAGMIHEGVLNVCNKSIKDFLYIVIEKDYPYAHAIYKLDELALEQGITLFKSKLLELKQCYDENYWPSYQTQVITLPNYANIGAI